MEKVHKFRFAIQIGDNVTDIMKLRCISFVTKNPNIGCGYHYCIYPGLMWDYKEDLSHKYFAHEGDWLCEDENGEWHILNDKEYKEYGKEEEK